MKQALLSLFWPRKELLQFFVDHDCSKKDLSGVVDFKEEGVSRAQMVDLVFEALLRRADGGLGQFRAMLHSLVNWSHFDPYYFDQLQKLDRAAATACIEKLRRLQEQRDASIKQQRTARLEQQRVAQEADATIKELRESFLTLHSDRADLQKRGYALEKVLRNLAKLSKVRVTEAFRVRGEQIDGAFKYDGEHYLLEAKWQHASASNEAVYQFAGKVEGKMYGRGLFVSMQGFSDHVIDDITRGKAVKTVFVDGEDITLVVEEQLTFEEMLDAKVKAAQTRGEIYVHPITLKPKRRS